VVVDEDHARLEPARQALGTLAVALRDPHIGADVGEDGRGDEEAVAQTLVARQPGSRDEPSALSSASST
jgi:hypothetical protein